MTSRRETMSWDSVPPVGSRSYLSANFGGRDFWLVPKLNGGGFQPEAQAEHAELLRFDDPGVRKYLEYSYESLPRDKKSIRLLKLYAGQVSGTEIYCELIQVEYDSEFHIPVKIVELDKHHEKGPGKRNNRTGNDTDDEGNRSDLETRWHEKEETEAETRERERRQEKRNMLNLAKQEGQDAEVKKREEKEKIQEQLERWAAVKAKEERYEALSWSWGDASEDFAILIKQGRKTFRKRVRKQLALALKYLRRPGKERTLWIDAICIDQANPDERNHQVQMMSRVYTRSQQVCIWLGEADTDSEIAIKFINSDMRELKNFDTITSDEQYSRKWRALMSLMQRTWFFRRWVVQEIALARAATVYCGPHFVPWKSFAVAVELFVEVETATHRLSEVMKRDEKFRHVPGWFEYVSELGASLLVQATGKVFRTKRTPLEPDGDSSEEDEADAKYDKRENDQYEKEKKKKKQEEQETEETIREAHTIDPLERRSLLSLEYLVSTMFIFQASEPRDVVYSLLAIARDASPFAPSQYGQEDQKLFLIMTLLDRILAEKPFEVDYNRPYSDVSRDFVKFCIERTYKTDPIQALDILCRPWALEPPKSRSMRLKQRTTDEKSESKKKRLLPERTKWKIRNSKVEKKANGEWEEKDRKFKYRYIKDDAPVWVKDDRNRMQYTREIVRKSEQKEKWTNTYLEGQKYIEVEWKQSPGWDDIKKRYFPDKDPSQPEQDINLPSWVARASQAPFMLDHAPGMEMEKTSRANADPLVGAPKDGHRNYNAAGSEKLDHDTLRFKKRQVLGHYSLYVKGFQLDRVVKVEDASQLGSIPRSWLELGGWTDLTKDPPNEFWRTIVADRGQDNRNPPYYYARACKESVHKGGHLGGSVNTTALINDEQNSIIAEFCRRVHAVIWNRCLFKTKGGRLGLASKVKEDDLVCILYGCTVPVILAEKTKEGKITEENKLIKEADLTLEHQEDCVESLKACIKRATANRERKAKYKPKKKEYEKKGQWQEMMDARNEYLKVRRLEKEAAQKKADERAKEAKIREERKQFKSKLAKRINEAKEVKRKSEQAKAEAEKDYLQESIQKIDESLESVIARLATAAASKAAAEQAVADQGAAEQAAAEQAAIEQITAVEQPGQEPATDEGAAQAGASRELAAGQAPSSQGTIEKTIADTDPARQAADVAIASENDVHQDVKTANDIINDANNAIKAADEEIAACLKAVVDYAEAEKAAISAADDGNATIDKVADEGSSTTGSNSVSTPTARSSTAGTSPAREAEEGKKKEEKQPEERDPKDYWYEFKGECYLHGMMDGEAMKEKFYKDIKNWIFELR